MTLGFTKFLGLCVDMLDVACFEIPTSDFQHRSTQPTGSAPGPVGSVCNRTGSYAKTLKIIGSGQIDLTSTLPQNLILVFQILFSRAGDYYELRTHH